MITATAKTLNPNNGIIGLQIRAPRTDVQRAIHLALLLDTSGSMEGGRMSALKRTLSLLVDRMKSEDKLTLIEYSYVGRVKAVAESDKDRLRAVIEEMAAGGGTCLESAIDKLFMLIRGYEHNLPIPNPDAVFIMTDGQINQGIHTGEGLSSLLSGALRDPVPVSTVGYGEDHNATLLQTLAVTTRGTYTFASSDEMLPAVIGNIMAGCEDEVARGLRVSLPTGTVCLELGSRKRDEEYYVGSIVAEKDQWVILESNSVDLVPEFLTIKFKSLGQDNIAQENSVTVRVERSQAEDTDVLVQWLRAKAVRFIHTCDKQSQHLAPMNLRLLETLEKEIRESPVCQHQLVQHILAELVELKTLLEELRDSRHGMNTDMLNRSITRLTSDTTAMGMQRGILSQLSTRTWNATLVPDPANSPFLSPRQRETTESMVQSFSQQPAEDPRP
jgi:uncharacterized protein YegL